MKYRIMQDEDGNNDVERYASAEILNPGMNWKSTGPDGCDAHCIPHPCGPCFFRTRGNWIWVATFKDINEAKRLYPGAALPTQCEECLAEVFGSNPICEDCCDHDDMENAECLNCGADRTEDLAAQAYDSAKAARQDFDT